MSKYGRFIFSLCALLAACAGCGKNDLSKKDQLLYLEVIKRIQAGGIKTDEQNGIKHPAGSVRLPQSASLPSDLQEASTDGEIYIFRLPENRLFVIFKTWRGKGLNMEGVLFAGGGLATGEISKDSSGRQTVTLDPIEFTLETRVNQDWYRVSYKLD